MPVKRAGSDTLLNDYRSTLIRRLKSCRSASAARGVVAEADGVLVGSRLAEHAQRRFWENVQREVEALEREARLMTDRDAGLKLAIITVAARAGITRCRENIRA
jgi:hypothetical protein